MRARIVKEFNFEAAQTLPSAPAGHKCRHMHGHSFRLEIAIEGEVDPKTGWIYDHAEITKVLRPILDRLDHSYLNGIAGLENPTIELMCAWLWEKIHPDLPGLCEIVLHETPTARCIFRGFDS